MYFTPIISSLDNLLVLLVFVLLSGASAWLKKRGSQRKADPGTEEAELPPSPENPRRLTRPPDWQEVLRQLLGGELPAQAPPPPMPSGPEQETFVMERSPGGQNREFYEGALEQDGRTVVPLRRRHVALTHATAVYGAAYEQSERTGSHGEKLNAYTKHPATASSNRRERHSQDGARAVALLRDTRTVRQMFAASLIFGPPKAMEN
jgi:hypothetical protein